MFPQALPGSAPAAGNGRAGNDLIKTAGLDRVCKIYLYMRRIKSHSSGPSGFAREGFLCRGVITPKGCADGSVPWGQLSHTGCHPASSSQAAIDLSAGSSGWGGDLVGQSCSSGNEKSQTPRSAPDYGTELMVCRKAGFVAVIFCPAEPLPGWAEGGNAASFLSNPQPSSRQLHWGTRIGIKSGHCGK